jgi:hypothetical protein
MNDYLAKPVRSEVLKKKLDAYIAPPFMPLKKSDSLRSTDGLPNRGSTRNEDADQGAGNLPQPMNANRSSVVLDPEEELAIFNRPVTVPGLAAMESPIQSAEMAGSSGRLPLTDDGEKTPTGPMASTNRSSSVETIIAAENAVDGTAAKRQPRKLTKPRTGTADSIAQLDKIGQPEKAEKPTVERSSSDMTHNVLTKRMPNSHQGTNSALDEGPRG